MVKEIEVEPVTRLEGHGGLRLVLNDDGTEAAGRQVSLRLLRHQLR